MPKIDIKFLRENMTEQTNELGAKMAKQKTYFIKLGEQGSGCGSVGRAVAFNTGGLWLESSHRQNLY